MRRMRRSVASSSVLAGIWEAPGFVRERFVSLISFAPTEYPVLAIQLSLDWATVYLTQMGGEWERPMGRARLAGYRGFLRRGVGGGAAGGRFLRIAFFTASSQSPS